MRLIALALAVLALSAVAAMADAPAKIPTGYQVRGHAAYVLVNGRVHAYRTDAGADVRHPKRFFETFDRLGYGGGGNNN